MVLLRALPLVATAALLGGGLALLADARDWNATGILAAAVVVTGVYLLAVAIPWLIREHTRPSERLTEAVRTDGTMTFSAGEEVRVRVPSRNYAPEFVTQPAVRFLARTR